MNICSNDILSEFCVVVDLIVLIDWLIDYFIDICIYHTKYNNIQFN